MRNDSRGFSLVEVLLALFLMGIGVLAAAPMFIYAMQGNAVGQDFGSAGALAVEHMERLRSDDWTALTAGGDLGSNVAGYSDDTDADFEIRWLITDNAAPVGTKTIAVRVISRRVVVGQRKEVVVTTVRGR